MEEPRQAKAWQLLVEAQRHEEAQHQEEAQRRQVEAQCAMEAQRLGGTLRQVKHQVVARRQVEDAVHDKAMEAAALLGSHLLSQAAPRAARVAQARMKGERLQGLASSDQPPSASRCGGKPQNPPDS